MDFVGGEIGFAFAIVAVTGILLWLCVAPRSGWNGLQAGQEAGQQGPKQQLEKGQGQGKFTAKDVAVHNKRDDCWLIIDDKVYDVSSFVEEHPGGDAILGNAGGNATAGFYGPQHPSHVFETVKGYCIGDLVAS